jgi:hypothetical protein
MKAETGIETYNGHYNVYFQTENQRIYIQPQEHSRINAELLKENLDRILKDIITNNI